MQLPRSNQKIEIKISHGPRAGTYLSYVEQLTDRSLVVAHPMMGGNLIPLTSGDSLRVEYALEGAARIGFATQVLGVDGGFLPTVEVALPEEDQVERFQQRDFVRLDANLSLLYYVIDSPDGVARPSGVFRSHTRDVSGNGAQILCPEPYPSGTQLDIHLEVEGQSVHVVGEVIREVQAVSAREHWMGIRFIGLDERDRDVLIRYIFNEQRARRRRGVL